MPKQKFQCKTCGAILIGEDARLEHCQIHHPGTPLTRLHLFFPIEYKEINGDEPELAIVVPQKPLKSRMDRHGNVTYISKKESNAASSFDCSKVIPINVLRCPRSSATDDLFEFAVKRVADINEGKPTLLDFQTAAQWSNICFGYPGLKTYEREQYMRRIKDKFRAYFKHSGHKYGFDFEQIVRDFPQYFKGGEGHKPSKKASLEALVAAVLTELNLSQQPKNRLKYKVQKIERVDAAKHLYQLHLELGDDDMPSFYEGITIKLKVGERFYDCQGIDYDIAEEILTVRANSNVFGGFGTIYLDTTFILKALIDKLNELKDVGFAPEQPGRKFIPDFTRNVSIVQTTGFMELPVVRNLDNFQRKAHEGAIVKDISFI